MQQLLDAIQTEKYATQPLAAHRIAGLEEHSREHYALLLAAVLRVRPAISAAQSRVFSMLLEAMGLANRQAALFERVKNLTAANLSESRRLIAEHGLAQIFLLDTFILLRLEQPLTDDDLRLGAELADLLQVDSKTLSALVTLALHVLGIKKPQAFSDILDPLDCPHWHEFICEKLTVAKLKGGIASGLWWLDQAIETDTGWSLENLTLFFTEAGRLSTDTIADAKVSIKGCRLINPVMAFKSQTLKFDMQDSQVEGRYPEPARLTAFQFDRLETVIFKNTHFTTRDARSVRAGNTPIAFEQCQFTACGNPLLVGGALAIRIPDIIPKTVALTLFFQNICDKPDIPKTVTLTDCHFIHCRARLGGALRIDRLTVENTAIINCIFAECSATEPGMNYGIYASRIVTSSPRNFIKACQFKRGRFYLGDGFLPFCRSNIDHVFSESKLIDAQLHASMRYENEFENEFKAGITPTGNSEIRTDVVHQLPAWAEDF
ncbi:MAG: hypothetical protein PHW13_02590 [Methylococcales bacterium]|nr:hypothetical protein [Methylococcales bacterium]